jgi:hypothetical protein
MADDDESGRDAPRRYAAGLPWVGARALDPVEVTWRRRQLSRLRWQVGGTLVALIVAALVVAFAIPAVVFVRIGGPGAAWLGAVGLVGLLGCLLYARGGFRVLAALGSLYLLGVSAFGQLQPHLLPRPEGLDAAVIVGMILLGTSFVVHTLVTRGVHVWRGRAITTDLDAGMVERYAGVVSQPPSAALQRLLGDRPDPRAEVRLDLLPASRLAVRVNGRRCAPWHAAHVAEVAAAQPHALRVELPRELSGASNDPRLKLERRSLTADERDELQAHARRLRERWGPVAAVTVAVVADASWRLATTTTSVLQSFDVVSLLWYGIAAVAWTSYARRLRAAYKLGCDQRLRWVVTVRNAGTDDDGSAPQLEVLPVSQLSWTEHAKPAGWRVDEL